MNIEEFIKTYSTLKGDEKLKIYVMPGTASAEKIGELLGEVSILFQILTGSGVEFRSEEINIFDLIEQ